MNIGLILGKLQRIFEAKFSGIPVEEIRDFISSAIEKHLKSERFTEFVINSDSHIKLIYLYTEFSILNHIRKSNDFKHISLDENSDGLISAAMVISTEFEKIEIDSFFDQLNMEEKFIFLWRFTHSYSRKDCAAAMDVSLRRFTALEARLIDKILIEFDIPPPQHARYKIKKENHEK